MLLITDRQVEQLGYRVWEEEMLITLREFAPRLFQIRGQAVFCPFIRNGKACAERHGFVRRGPVRLFIQTMVSLGHRFDEDPQLHGIVRSLQSREGEEMDRSRRLYLAITDYYDQVMGPDNLYAVDALTRLLGDDSLWEAPVPATRQELEEHMLERMRGIFPQKLDYMGQDTGRRIVASALESAEHHGLHPFAGGRVLGALMFALGWGIADDPLYPWVSGLLDASRHGLDYDRGRHLAAQSRIYLKATLQHLGESMGAADA